jgi:hypothetical protein
MNRSDAATLFFVIGPLDHDLGCTAVTGAVLPNGAKELFESQVDSWIQSFMRAQRLAMPHAVRYVELRPCQYVISHLSSQFTDSIAPKKLGIFGFFIGRRVLRSNFE